MQIKPVVVTVHYFRQRGGKSPYFFRRLEDIYPRVLSLFETMKMTRLSSDFL